MNIHLQTWRLVQLCTLGLDEIQIVEDQPIKTYRVHSARKSSVVILRKTTWKEVNCLHGGPFQQQAESKYVPVYS